MNDVPRGRSLTSAAAWVLQGRVLVAGSALVTNLILARVLDAGSLADIYLCWSTVLLLSVVGALGLPQTLVRLLGGSGVGEAGDAGNDGNEGVAGLVASSLLLSLAGAVAVALVQVVLLAPLYEFAFGVDRSWLERTLLGVWTGLTALTLVAAEVHRGLHDVRRAARFGGALTGVLTVVLLVPLALPGVEARVWHVLALISVAHALNLACAVAALRRHRVVIGRGGALRTQAGLLLGASWPVLVGGVTFVAAAQVDLWIAGLLVPHHEVAGYGLAVRVALVVAIPLNVANGALAPRLARLHARGQRTDVQHLLRSAWALMMGATLLSAVPIGIWSAPLLVAAFGPAWSDAATMLRLLLLAQIAIVASGPAALLLAMSGNQVRLMQLTLLGTSMLVGGAFVGGAFFGGAGIACAAAGSMLLQGAATVLVARRLTGCWPVGFNRRGVRGVQSARLDVARSA